MWLRKFAWPILAVVIFVLEMWAIFEGDGNTISDWITDFPILLWIPAMILFVWLPFHFLQKRRDREGNDDVESL